MNLGSFNCQRIEPSDSHGFSKMDLAYWCHPEQFRELLNNGDFYKDIEKKIIERKSFPLRNEIQSILKKQYSTITPKSKAHEAIELLGHENSFTVVCAHQPCLLGGPWYWLYKITTTLSICHQLRIKYKDYHFIPVYFIGSEDHDFEEINHVHIFHQKLSWNEESGKSTGHLPVNGLTSVLDQLEQLFPGNEFASNFIHKQHLNLSNSSNYGNYYQQFVDDLFGDFGLVSFNPNDESAKPFLKEILDKEIKDEFIYQSTKKANDWIEHNGFTLQVNPRPVNLFYQTLNARVRLDKHSPDSFSLKDNSQHWDFSALVKEIFSHPERFSPNVLMRPLYQETLFPNLVFVGGGAEISYWLQLKYCFDQIGLSYPVLVRRMSGVYCNKAIQAKISKTIFRPIDFLNALPELESKYVSTHTDQYPIHEDAINQLNDKLDDMSRQIQGIDESTRVSMEADLHKIRKLLETISSKQSRYIKHRHDSEIKSIQNIKEALFPAQQLQERHFNFLPSYFEYGPELIKSLIRCYTIDTPNFYLIEES